MDFSFENLNFEKLKDYEIVFIEGYLFSEKNENDLLVLVEKIKESGTKIAFLLSSVDMVKKIQK